MKILNLRDAIRLYRILSKYIDKVDEDITVLNFLSDIIKKMGIIRPDDYSDCLFLFTGMEVEDLVEKYTSLEILDVFKTGLINNRISSLLEFGRTLA